MDRKIENLLESELKDKEYPDFESGDTIRVKTSEEIGGQMRSRQFEGVCIARDGKGPNQTFKVRKDSFGVGVERIFPLYSSIIQDIEIVRKGKVRRAKLNYLEGRSSKESRIEEKRVDLDEVNRVESDPDDEVQSEDTEQEESEAPTEESASDESPESEQQADSQQASSQENQNNDDQQQSNEESSEAGSDEDQKSTEDSNPSDEPKEEVGESV